MKNKRISDQILVCQAISIVREELASASARDAGDIEVGEIMTRLTSLYACINTERLIETLKLADNRSKYGK